MVVKSGFVAWGASGSGSGSTRLPQPRRMAAFYGGLGNAPARLSHVFVSQECLDDSAARDALPRGHRYTAVQDSRGLSCADMRFNTLTPTVQVSPEPEPVLIDGDPVPLHHATQLPLTRAHHLA